MRGKIVLDKKQIDQDFSYLHKNGEVAFQEIKTTKYIAKRLEQMGISYELFDNMPGLIATLGVGNPIIGMRADIDALKQEYKGKIGVFHSCGHDAHMSIVLAVAAYFSSHPKELNGTLKLIFQPAEETISGAKEVIKSGKLRHLDYLYGLHVCPESEIKLQHAEPIIQAAATRTLWVKLIGKSSYAGNPQAGANVIDAFTKINEQLMNINLDTKLPYFATTTMFHSGESSNVIPDRGKFAIDYRARTNTLMDILEAKIFTIFHEVAKNNIKLVVEGKDSSPASVPSQEAISVMKTAIEKVFGKSGLVESHPTQGGDDFHFYAYEHIASNSTMLGLGCNLKPGLHIPGMTFEKSALYDGAKIMISSVILTSLKRKSINITEA